MRDLLPTLLPRLEGHNIPGLKLPDGPQELGWVFPFYDGLSLTNMPASICHWLGVPPFGAPPFSEEIIRSYSPGFRQVILLVVDGMGLDGVQQALAWAGQTGGLSADFAIWGEMAERATLAPLTSVCPSTTATALTTFWTGCPPAAHGIMGYEMWLKEYGVIANMILHSPSSFLGDVGSLRKAGFDPETFLPVPILGEHLAAHGVQAHAFQHAAIARSGLSTMLMPGVEIHPFRSLSDLWVTLGGLIDTPVQDPRYCYIYWGDLDEHSHRFGPQDPRAQLEFASFSRQLGYFLRERMARQREDTLLIITADHGHISTPRSPHYELRNHPELMSLMTMGASGEARLPYVYLRPGTEERFLHYLEAAWPGEFLAIPSDQAIQSGLFGQGDAGGRLAERVGDYVVLPRDGAYWWFSNRENPLLGRHGGLSRTEMLTPFFAFAF